MNISQTKEVVIRFNKEFLARGDSSVLEEIVAADFINRTAAGSVPNNVEGLKEFIAILHKGFSNFHI